MNRMRVRTVSIEGLTHAWVKTSFTQKSMNHTLVRIILTQDSTKRVRIGTSSTRKSVNSVRISLPVKNKRKEGNKYTRKLKSSSRKVYRLSGRASSINPAISYLICRAMVFHFRGIVRSLKFKIG